jgi:hypothetical protein
LTEAQIIPDETSRPVPPARRRRSFWTWAGNLTGALAVIVFGSFGVLAIALAIGPVSLGPLAPVLMRAVSDTVAGYRLDASDALLVWSEEGRLVVRFVDPTLVDDDGIEIASASDIAVSFSFEALFLGNIAPRSLDIVGPTATFMRMSDGSYDIGIRTESRDPDRQMRSTEADAGPFIRALLEPPVDGEEETYLSEIRLNSATITFIDEATSSIVKAPRGTLIVRRTVFGLVASLKGQVALPGKNWEFFAEATYARGASHITVDAGIADANLDALAEAGPLFEPFDGIELPLSGDLKLMVDTDGKLLSATTTITAGRGTLKNRALSDLPLEVASADMVAVFDGVKDQLELQRLQIDSDAIAGRITGLFQLRRSAEGLLAGWQAQFSVSDGRMVMPAMFDGETPIQTLNVRADNDLKKDVLTLQEFRLVSGETSVDVAGTVTGVAAGAVGLKLAGTVSNLPLDRLGSLWPQGVAQGARDWISQNVKGGIVTRGDLAVNATAEQLAAPSTPDSIARFAFEFRDLSISYIEGLPLLTEVTGSAVVLGNSFDARIVSGRGGPLRLSDGRVEMRDLGRRGDPALISAVITGTAQEVLGLLDMKPLGYPSRFGLNPDDVKGDAVINLNLVVPTLKALLVEDIVFDVKAGLTNVAMEVVKGFTLTGGEADFIVTGAGLEAKGKGTIAGVLATFTWSENFQPGPSELSTKFSARATITEDLRTRVGIDPGSYLDGDADVEVSMIGDGFVPMSASARADLTGAAISIPELGFSKAAGVQALMTAELERLDDAYRARPVRLTGDGIDAELDILVGLDGALKSIRANRLVAGRNDVAFTVDLANGRPNVVADVAVIDLDTLIDALTDPAAIVADMSGPEEPVKSSASPTDVKMQIQAKRVLLRGGMEAQDLTFNVDIDKGELVDLLVLGGIGGGTVEARLWPQPDGRRRVYVDTTAIGAVVHGLTGFDSLAATTGRLDMMFPKRGDPGNPSGAFEVTDFRLLHQPFLVRLLASGSFTGLIDLMNGDGILFDHLGANVTLNGERIEVRDLKMTGPSAGAMGEGFVDRSTDVLEAAGTLAPIYSLNSILGDMPVVGDILGGEGGILAITFAIDGTVDKLGLSVNPFSAIAPGILRELFEYKSPLPPPPALPPGG